MGYAGNSREGWGALSLGDRRRMGTAQSIGSLPHASSPWLHGSALSIPHCSTSKVISVARRRPSSHRHREVTRTVLSGPEML